jgi:hypothetical protein
MSRDQRSLTATVIAIVSPDLFAETAATLASLSGGASVRPLIISLGDDPGAPRRDENGATVIEGLPARYLDNAVASLRLSSLPAAAWYRAGDPGALQDLAKLVDRIVLDLEHPAAAWALVPAIAPLAPVSDIRWARLTRWRELVAQFFEAPEVRSMTWERLSVTGADAHDAALLAGWLRSRLPGGAGLEVVHHRRAAARLESVELSGTAGRLSVRLLPSGTCLETLVDLRDARATSRAVSRGDDHLATLLGDELRVRSRDLAFEDAARAAGQS